MPLGLSPAQSCLCRGCSPGREDQLKHFLFAWAACSPWLIPGLLPVLMEEAGSCLPASGLVQSHRHVLAPESQAKECATSGSFSCLDMISCGIDGWCVCGSEALAGCTGGAEVLLVLVIVCWCLGWYSCDLGHPSRVARCSCACMAPGVPGHGRVLLCQQGLRHPGSCGHTLTPAARNCLKALSGSLQGREGCGAQGSGFCLSSLPSCGVGNAVVIANPRPDSRLCVAGEAGG